VKRLNKSKKLTIALICMLLSVAITAVASAQFDEYSDEAAWAFWGFTGLFCIIPIVIFVIWIVLAIWVYKDAEKRGSSGALWLIIVIITGIIGLIVWLVVRPPIGGAPASQQAAQARPPEPERRCPNCGRPIPMDARVCPYCSKKFE
jgi:Na+/H+-dicarboxylate symporter